LFLLLFRLLWSYNSLFSERALQSLKLRGGHLENERSFSSLQSKKFKLQKTDISLSARLTENEFTIRR
jgi:hypothetical protein